ncbi:MAG: N-6 DNA methylase, partial [Acidobacteria bacterium]|nr:N-6 DNA methylase [Acidobacteriota bacterium]
MFGSLDNAREVIEELVERYQANRDRYKSSTYNEETARNEFINPFFEALGWDVSNRSGAAEQYKDVIHEESIITVRDYSAPDYTFRFGGMRKFFVEAKKPAIDLKASPAPAHQLRRYAWSLKLPLSILTNFEEFVVYDTRIKPRESDKASVGRILYIRFDELLPKLEEIWGIFSKEAVLKGSFDRYVEDTRGKRGTSEVDDEFLKEIEGWRQELAKNIALRNPDLSADDLNFAVQATIDRIIFMRIAEDRGVEGYGRLLALTNGPRIYARLVELYRKADTRYNSGLFDFHADQLTPGLTIDDKVLKPILANLYHPQSPYEFSVLPVEILGNVYEQFLGKVIRLTKGHRASIDEKPEVRKAGGVYYTPSYVVDYIVETAVGSLTKSKSPKQLERLRILDPACGSGSFLIVAYQHLLNVHLAWYQDHKPQKHKKEVFLGRGGWRLTTAEKRRILLNNIYGVDIDRQAVEVTKLSLLLKVLEGENNETLTQQSLFGERALPSLEQNIKCGNSLIGSDLFIGELFPNREEMRTVNPLDWGKEFPRVMKGGGFDAVIGNPPYLNIDDTYGTKDVRLGLIKSAYPDVYTDKTDILFYFLTKGIQLCRGRLAFIVSRAFLEAYKATRLRNYLLAHAKIERIIDFQNFHVFRGIGITTCIVILQP